MFTRKMRLASALVGALVLTLASCSSGLEASSVSVGSNDASRSAHTFGLPAKIEAELWSASAGIQVESSLGVTSVRIVDNGGWVDYPINVPVDAEYSFVFRLSSPVSTGQFDVQIENQTIRRNDSPLYWGIARIDVPNTGSRDSWVSLPMKANLTKGPHTLRLWAAGKEFNVDSITIGSSVTPIPQAIPLPATIQPETVLLSQPPRDPLQIQTSSDGTVYATMNYLSLVGTSKWTFQVNSFENKTFQFAVRTSSPYNPKLGLTVDGALVRVLPLPNTGSYDTSWAVTTSTVYLSPGIHTILVEPYGTSYSDGAPFNLDYIQFY